MDFLSVSFHLAGEAGPVSEVGFGGGFDATCSQASFPLKESFLNEPGNGRPNGVATDGELCCDLRFRREEFAALQLRPLHHRADQVFDLRIQWQRTIEVDLHGAGAMSKP